MIKHPNTAQIQSTAIDSIRTAFPLPIAQGKSMKKKCCKKYKKGKRCKKCPGRL